MKGLAILWICAHGLSTFKILFRVMNKMQCRKERFFLFQFLVKNGLNKCFCKSLYSVGKSHGCAALRCAGFFLSCQAISSQGWRVSNMQFFCLTCQIGSMSSFETGLSLSGCWKLWCERCENLFACNVKDCRVKHGNDIYFFGQPLQYPRKSTEFLSFLPSSIKPWMAA